MAARDRLRLRRQALRRGPDSVQFGIDAALVLSGLGPGEHAVLQALAIPRTRPELYAVGARHGIAPARVDRLVGVLHEHGLLGPVAVDRMALAGLPVGLPDTLVNDARLAADTCTPAADPPGDLARGDLAPGELARGDLARADLAPGELARRILRRHTRRVLVDGSGDLAGHVAGALRRAGVGEVRLGSMTTDDVDLRLRAPGPASAVDHPALVVLVAAEALDPDRARPWRRRGIPHLPVVAEGARVSVGPLVGSWSDGACLSCLDLHRADADPAWPTVLAGAVGARAPTGLARTDTTLATTVAGVVAMLACGVLDGRPIPAGVAVEVSLPLPRLDHRRWERHPRCPDHTAYGNGVTRVTMAG